MDPKYIKMYKKVSLYLLLVFALLIRLLLFKFHSPDFDIFLVPWVTYFKSHGGFEAFKTIKYQVSNYNVVYLYYIALISYLPIPALFAIKLLSVVFDFVLSYFVYKIVKLKYPSNSFPMFAGILTLFAPTVLMNSALWAQCDSIYVAFITGSFYFLLKKRMYLAISMFAVGLLFKLQAIFLVPLLIIMFLYGYIKIKHFLIAIPIYIASIIPAVLLGKPLLEVIQIYMKQSGESSFLSVYIPNIYSWLPNTPDRTLYGIAAVVLTAAICLLFYYIVFDKIKSFTRKDLVQFAFILFLLVPTFLPAMHERYYYPAEIFSIIYAFSFPKYFYIPIALEGISTLSYINAIFYHSIVPIPILAIATVILLLVVLYQFIKPLYFPIIATELRIKQSHKIHKQNVSPVKTQTSNLKKVHVNR